MSRINKSNIWHINISSTIFILFSFGSIKAQEFFNIEYYGAKSINALNMNELMSLTPAEDSAYFTHRSGIKTKKGGKYENQHKSVWERYGPLAQKRKIRGHFKPTRQRMKNIFDRSYPDGYRDKLTTIK